MHEYRAQNYDPEIHEEYPIAYIIHNFPSATSFIAMPCHVQTSIAKQLQSNCQMRS